jgi:hypothetical protein
MRQIGLTRRAKESPAEDFYLPALLGARTDQRRKRLRGNIKSAKTALLSKKEAWGGPCITFPVCLGPCVVGFFLPAGETCRALTSVLPKTLRSRRHCSFLRRQAQGLAARNRTIHIKLAAGRPPVSGTGNATETPNSFEAFLSPSEGTMPLPVPHQLADQVKINIYGVLYHFEFLHNFLYLAAVIISDDTLIQIPKMQTS